MSSAPDPSPPVAARMWAALALAATLTLTAPGCGPEASADESPRASPMFDAPAPDGGERPAASPAIPANAPTVAFLGDSLSAGLHLPADRAFPAVLQRRLAAQGLPFHLVNAGVSGDTTAGGARRVDWLLEQDPDVLVVELGGNDGLRGQPVDAIEANLRTILTRAAEEGVAALLVAIRIPPSYGPDYLADFRALYPRLAEEFEIPLVDDFLDEVGGEPSLLLRDGLHPNVEGHERLADTLEGELRELVEGVAGG